MCYDVYRCSRRKKDLLLQQQYVKERKDLQGTEVKVKNTVAGRGRKKGSVETWTVCNNEEEEFVSDLISDNEVGLRGVDFNHLDAGDRGEQAGQPV